ncbi:hypothetical protein [Nitrosomonas sp. Nm132]|uniref:hypothetical protein n=1 Tax=Nitrosomonas sp. Nm132 TaxID=1881053 RepID=UPI00159F9DBC|nr:hypothetical protein [Nitrosomonas sp. Nm132]
MEFYFTCFQGRLQPKVLDIHLPRTAWRPQIAGVAAPSAARSGISFIRFIPSLCHRSGNARAEGECLK